MAGSVIGALRVNLGMDSAQFTRGLRGAETGLQRFGRIAAQGLAVVASAAFAATGALTLAVRGTLGQFDELTKLSRSIGVPVEELSRLQHAADLAGLSVEQLGTGMRSLSQRMLQVAQGSGLEARRGFEALGVSIQNADGTLRASTDVLNDVADKFASMEDGATKTGLAVALFGRQGAAMISMLNLGSSGLAEMGDEAERLGLVISQNTGEAAERFNDNMRRVHLALTGIINSVTAALLPALGYLSDAFFNATANGEQMRNMAANLAEIFKMVVTAAVVAAEAIKAVGYSLTTLMRAAMLAQGGAFGMAFSVLQHGFQDVAQSAADATEFVQGLWAAVEAGGDGLGHMPIFSEVMNFGKGAGETDPFVPIISGAGQATEAIDLVGDSVANLTEKTKTFGDLAFDAFSNMGSELAHAFFAGGNIAKNVVDVLIDRVGKLADMLIDQAFNLGLSMLLNTFTGGGGLLSGLFGGGASSFVGSGFGAMFANGTDYAPGGMALVGERGPELVNLPRGSQVFDAESTRSMSGGEKTVIVQIADMGVPREYTERLITAFNDAIGDGATLRMA